MGEIADAMINGELCEQCGVYIGAGDGYPRLCAGCAEEDGVDAITREPSGKVKCDICGKRVKRVGLKMHKRDVHGEG